MHAFPLRVASMPAVRSDLNGGLLTCLCFIMYQEYTVICIFDQMHVNLIWYLYPFMLNKICLSLSLSLNDTDILTPVVHVCMLLIYRVQKDKVWRCISVTSISRSLGLAACLGLPGMHLFSGCDSTSQFLGKSKKTALQYFR